MAMSEAKRLSNKKSDAKYMQLLLKPYKEEGQRIRDAAAAAGQSVQAYVLEAVRMRMDQERADENGAEASH